MKGSVGNCVYRKKKSIQLSMNVASKSHKIMVLKFSSACIMTTTRLYPEMGICTQASRLRMWEPHSSLSAFPAENLDFRIFPPFSAVSSNAKKRSGLQMFAGTTLVAIFDHIFKQAADMFAKLSC